MGVGVTFRCVDIVAFLLLQTLFIGSAAHAGVMEDIMAAGIASGRGDTDEAIKLYTQAIASDELGAGSKSKALTSRGGVWFSKRDYDRAIADYDEAIGLDPQYSWALVARGNAWLHKTDYDRAAADYNEAIRLNPRSVAAFVGRGNISFSKRNYDGAIADYDEAVRLNPHSAIALEKRAGAQYYMYRFAAAAADFADAQRIRPNAYTSLMLFLSRSWADMPNAKSELAGQAKTLTNDWPRPIVDFYLGELRPDDVLARAADKDPLRQRRQVCQADWYIGELYSIERHGNAAIRIYEKRERDCS